MLHLRADSKKIMPCFIQDFGIYNASMSFEERTIPKRQTKNEEKVTIENSKNLILEYLELEKKINSQKEVLAGLESKKINLSKKIMNNPELRQILEELMSSNMGIKTMK